MWHKIIQDKQNELKNLSIKPRDYYFDPQLLELNKIISFIGPRRAGKTFLMLHLVQELVKNEIISREQVVFIDFTLYEGQTIDPTLLLQEYYELYPGLQPFFVFDEIQEIANFKQFIFSLFTGHHKIFLSGSNSKLLSSELSTEFRGKTYEFQVQPLIAREVLSFYNLPRKEHYSTIELAEINRLYQKIFQYGSFPEIVMMDNNFTKQELLKSYFNILFFKDLIGRYHIENSAILRDLIKNLTLGFTKEVNITTTYKELKRQEIPVSPATLYEYYDNLKSTFYGHELTNFYSQHGQKKLYLDNIGFHYLFSLTTNFGQSFENIVFRELRKVYEKLRYEKGRGEEIDFYVEEKNLHIQVCSHLSSTNFEREIKSLKLVKGEKVMVYWEDTSGFGKGHDGIKIIHFLDFVREYC